METMDHIGRLGRCMDCGGSYAQAHEFSEAFLLLKGNHA